MIRIRDLSKAELTGILTSWGESRFRGTQVFDWIWKKHATTFQEMSNLSHVLRSRLEENFEFNILSVTSSQISSDRTIKNGFRLQEGFMVEGVLIPTQSRTTACVSSQAGCSLDCKFCATGTLKRMRNLYAWEIYDQVVAIKNQAIDHYQLPLTHIVYMGMGEPLLNYQEVMKSIAMITSPDGLGMSPQRITVSTAGIAKMIYKLGDEEVKFNLALSLHAANDAKRSEIMTINESNDLETLKNALKHFYYKTGTRPTLEYIVFSHFNDGENDARDLIRFAKSFPSKINLIEYNTVENTGFNRASDSRLNQFAGILEKNGLIVNIRRSRGRDIDAACGQLANKNQPQ